MNPPPTIACLGPEGSFSHLITQMRFPGVAVSLRDNVGDVFDFLCRPPGCARHRADRKFIRRLHHRHGGPAGGCAL
jgi:hypothetical protein